MTTAESNRRLHSLVRTGRVTAVDHLPAGPVARVQDGEIVTGWLPLLHPRCGMDRVALAPTVGEQVVILSPGGSLEQGIILGSLPQTDHPSPADAEGVHRATYDDGAIIEYDRTAHRLRAILPDGATAEIEAPGGLTLKGDLTVDGEVTANGIHLSTHTHPGVTNGPGSTGAPQ
jgi:phage baseplate assembly protein V